ncbi:MAG TPA: hypothetical protein VFL15_02070 [Gammaproteobacteria bacterium]|nr:hypothetical protein [Gammaproteobacteria bacterium]
MKSARAFAVGIVLCGFEMLCAHGVEAAELCHTPAPETLINWYQNTHRQAPLHYSPKNSAIYHPVATLRTTSPALTWIGLAWLSPVSGALFAVSCEGQPLAAISRGAVGKLSAGPVLPEFGQTVVLEYVDRETAHCVHDSIDIAAFKAGQLRVLWTHESKQGMNLAGKRTRFHGFVSRNYYVKIDSDGKAIHVTGEIAAYRYLKDGAQSTTPASKVTLPAETYRWDEKKTSFVAQGRYRQFKPCVSSGWPSAK